MRPMEIWNPYFLVSPDIMIDTFYVLQANLIYLTADPPVGGLFVTSQFVILIISGSVPTNG